MGDILIRATIKSCGEVGRELPGFRNELLHPWHLVILFVINFSVNGLLLSRGGSYTVWRLDVSCTGGMPTYLGVELESVNGIEGCSNWLE